jgi:hypothetical protein
MSSRAHFALPSPRAVASASTRTQLLRNKRKYAAEASSTSSMPSAARILAPNVRQNAKATDDDELQIDDDNDNNKNKSNGVHNDDNDDDNDDDDSVEQEFGVKFSARVKASASAASQRSGWITKPKHRIVYAHCHRRE